MSDNNTRQYEARFPVFKQGDDLGHYLAEVGKADPSLLPNMVAAEAFKRLAAQYEEAALMAHRLASVASEVPGLEVSADCHCVWVTGPRDVIDPLTAPDGDGDLSVDPFEDDGEDEDWGEDECPFEEEAGEE